MHASLGIDFRGELARHVRELGSLDDVEVVVGCVAAGVAFCSDSGSCRHSKSVFLSWNGEEGGGKVRESTEDDKILRDAYIQRQYTKQ